MELLIRDATVFDGEGGPPQTRDVLVRDGVIERIAPCGELAFDGETVNAHGLWLTPGFIDLHTHYDAEIEIGPALPESLRHGVTSVLLGSCGLSMAVGRPVDLADMFCRVEGIPRSVVLPLFERIKDWEDPVAYLDHLEQLPLGPNVGALLGHSAVRAHVLGIGRALDHAVRPTEDELQAMERMVEQSLDAGFVGLSINTLPWDKMDGDDYRSRPTPSVFARWSEYARLAAVLRRRGRVFQGVPNLSTRINIFRFFWETISRPLFRRPLRTMLLTLADAGADRTAVHLVRFLSSIVNRVLGGDLRWQALPHEFDLWSDGLDVPIIEELGTGTEALHLTDPAERAALLRDPAFRRRWKRQWRIPIAKAWHRNLKEARVVSCPDAALNGRTFADVAAERGTTPLDTFLDLNAEHGDALRWYTVAANDRPRVLETIVSSPHALIGFSDAGAHLRNMGFYNFPLRMLRRVRDAERAGRPFMTVGRAVQRLTSEIADWLDLPAGRLREGAPADLVLIDPERLDDAVEALHEEEMPGFPGLFRLVRRNDATVPLVLVGGTVAWRDGAFAPPVGDRRLGRVLRSTRS